MGAEHLDQAGLTALELKKLRKGFKDRSKTEREEYLYEWFLKLQINYPDLPPSKTYTKRMLELKKLFNLSEGYLFQKAKAQNWREKEAEAIMNAAHLKAEVAAMDAGVSQSSIEFMMKTDVKLADLVTTVKGHTAEMLDIGRELTMVASTMIKFYLHKQRALMSTYNGALEKMTSFDAEQIETWAKRIEYYQRSISEFVKPSSVAGYLKLLNLNDNVPVEVESEAFTVSALQEALVNLGMTNVFEDKALRDAVFSEHGELPDTTGRQ